MIGKKYISSVAVDGTFVPVTGWRLAHNRRSPADYLTFDPVDAVTGAEAVLKFGDSEGMTVIFSGGIIRQGPTYAAVDSECLFAVMKPKSFINTTVHAVVRDICRQAGIKGPEINTPNAKLTHFQAEKSPAIALRSLIDTMIRLGILGASDLSFYFDPSGQFYFGGFRDWKRDVEILQEQDNLLDFKTSGSGFLAEVLPGTEIYHSQQVRVIHDFSPADFYRVESVTLLFFEGEHRETLYLQAV